MSVVNFRECTITVIGAPSIRGEVDARISLLLGMGWTVNNAGSLALSDYLWVMLPKKWNGETKDVAFVTAANDRIVEFVCAKRFDQFRTYVVSGDILPHKHAPWSRIDLSCYGPNIISESHDVAMGLLLEKARENHASKV